MLRVFNCLKVQICSKKQIRSFKDIVPIVMSYTEYKIEETDLSKTPIFIMHGLMETQQNWSKMAEKLAVKTKHRVITLDARNHGKSPHSPEHGSDHLAADVEEILRILRINKIIAIGYSMGGFCMMTLALSKPLFVEKAIILEASPYGLPSDTRKRPSLVDVLLHYIPSLPKEMSIDQGREAAIKTISEHSGGEANTHMILEHLYKNENGSFQLGYNLNAIGSHWNDYANFEETIKNYGPYQSHALFIGSKQSNRLKPSHIPGIKRYFPYMTAKWIDATGMLHVMKPNETLDTIVNFIIVKEHENIDE